MPFALNRRQAFTFTALAAACATPLGRALAQVKAMLPIELSMWGAKRSFRDHPRAVIVSYPIRFILGAEANAGGKVGIFLTLRGPTEADMKALTAEAHKDLSERLAAIGLPVVPAAEMLSNAEYLKLEMTPGGAAYNQGVLDPMGKRLWYITGCPDAPLHAKWGSNNGGAEFSSIGQTRGTSRTLNAVALIPYLTLEFTTLTGAVSSGRQGSTAWAGGEILFGYKPHSITYYTSGGKRPSDNLGGGIVPKGRILIAPSKLPGQLNSDVQSPNAELVKRMGRARIDEFAVDMAAWREWVRLAYRSYNAELARTIGKELSAK